MDEKAVKVMYGVTGNQALDLTPEKFEAINKNKDDLKRIRDSLKQLKKANMKKKLMSNLTSVFDKLKQARKKKKEAEKKKEEKMLGAVQPPTLASSSSIQMKKLGGHLKFVRRKRFIESLSVKKGGDGMVEAIISSADNQTRREYIPLTFDGLMVDFGQSAERKAIWQKIGGAFKNLMT
jgi:hypothetical protein